MEEKLTACIFRSQKNLIPVNGKERRFCVRFEVFTAVTMMTVMFDLALLLCTLADPNVGNYLQIYMALNPGTTVSEKIVILLSKCYG